jgi:hypothetical protein
MIVGVGVSVLGHGIAVPRLIATGNDFSRRRALCRIGACRDRAVRRRHRRYQRPRHLPRRCADAMSPRHCPPCPVVPRPSAPHVLLAAAVSPPSSLRVISALYSAYSIWRFVRFAAVVAASDQRRAHPVERLRAPARLLIVLSLLDTNVLLSPSNQVCYNSNGVAHSPP